MSNPEAVFDELDTPIGGVPSHKIMAVWERVEPMLRRVVKPHTGYTLGTVLTDLQLGKLQLWIIGNFDAVAITAIQERPVQRVLWCQFIVGDNVEKWLDDWERVQTEFAKANGCEAVEFSGRKGWLKYQKKLRYRDYLPILTTFRKEL